MNSGHVFGGAVEPVRERFAGRCCGRGGDLGLGAGGEQGCQNDGAAGSHPLYRSPRPCGIKIVTRVRRRLRFVTSQCQTLRGESRGTRVALDTIDMWWRIALLLLAPYAYAIALGLTARKSAQVRIEVDRTVFGPCAGTDAQPRFIKRPRMPEGVSVVDLPVRGWKRIELAGVRLDTNLAKRDAESLAATAASGLRFLEAETGLAGPAVVRAFANERQFREYAESIGAPAGCTSFFDATRGEVVVHRANAWQVAGEALHQIAHALCRGREGLPAWLEEGLAEVLSAAEFDGQAVRWSVPTSADPPAMIDAVRGAAGWPEFSKVGSGRERRAACRAMAAELIREGKLRAALKRGSVGD